MKNYCNIAFMNDVELITYLKGLNKPYQNIIPQSTFTSTIIRYDAGLLKPNTLIVFFNKMGYIKINGLWQKK